MLNEYLDRGGFLFAAAIRSSPEFSDSLRGELGTRPQKEADKGADDEPDACS